MEGESTKMFQIKEDDLATLESVLPGVFERLMFDGGQDTNAMRVAFRRVQQIIVNVRWNYGPATDIERSE